MTELVIVSETPLENPMKTLQNFMLYLVKVVKSVSQLYQTHQTH